MSTTTPVYTQSTAGNVRSSGTLAAGASANYDLDFSGVFEGQMHIKNTPGSSVASPRGLTIEFFRRFGNASSGAGTLADSPAMTYTLPSATASTAESGDYFLPTGKWNVKITNLDGSNGITVEITSDTVASLTTA